MQIILSRKGFDSQYGGQPSPILPDGTLLSLPIPSKDDTIQYTELSYSCKNYLEIIKELNPNSKFKDQYTCHLDPDLRKDMIKRENEWKPLFGQNKAAQGHLKNMDIKEGDLFLFFGWFKETEQKNGTLKYIKGAPDMHMIFGYLQIGEIFSDFSNFPKEIHYHPHAQNKFEKIKNNCIYKASNYLSFHSEVSGGGCLNFHNDLVLTKKGYSKSKWELPSFFQDISISYHSKESFVDDYFQSAAKGQEFIIEKNDSVSEWAKNLIINNKTA